MTIANNAGFAKIAGEETGERIDGFEFHMMKIYFSIAMEKLGIFYVDGVYGNLMPDVKLNVSNAIRVEFYLDGELQYVDEDEPFEWKLSCKIGLHTVEVMAYNERNTSKAIVDILAL